MAPIPKDSAAWLSLLRQEMNEIFGYLSKLDITDKMGEHEFIPLLDIYETADAYMVEVDLPGFSEKELSLTINGTTLVVEGYKRKERGSRRMRYICLERSFGRFCRTVDIPPAFDVTGVKAKYERGVLSVAFPRLPDKGVVIREIPIVQGD